MTQIPILSGIYTDGAPDFRAAYPVNMVPVPVTQGISLGYLRPASGIVLQSATAGPDRGGIKWRGQLYRVLGSKLTLVPSSGALTDLGDVGTGARVTFDYSFDRLAIASDGKLWYWDGGALTQVTDPDLGLVIDVVWVDGYFMTTDGEFLVVTDLNDPTAVNPLKYGSSEADPDPVVGLLKVRNEVYAINRNTIEVFTNIGGDLFPFQRIEGAQIQKGAVGTQAACVYLETIAFLGSGRNEAPGIYLGANGVARKISTYEIDTVLQGYSEDELSTVALEARNDKARQELWIRLPDRTLVYDGAASTALEQQVWHTLVTTLEGFERHAASGLVWAYDRWNIGDPGAARIGYLDDSISTHWGEPVRWEFGTLAIYNEGRGAIVHQLELVALTGRIAPGTTPRIATSYSLDGVVWSNEAEILAGDTGDRAKRLVWLQQGYMRQWRLQRFRGTSDAHLSVARLEAALEPLAY